MSVGRGGGGAVGVGVVTLRSRLFKGRSARRLRPARDRQTPAEL